MGSCLSKKEKKWDGEAVAVAAAALEQDSRDPPPTESPDEKVKEVLSESQTPKLVTFKRSSSRRGNTSSTVISNGAGTGRCNVNNVGVRSHAAADTASCECELSTTTTSNTTTTTTTTTLTEQQQQQKARSGRRSEEEEEELEEEEGEVIEMKRQSSAVTASPALKAKPPKNMKSATSRAPTRASRDQLVSAGPMMRNRSTNTNTTVAAYNSSLVISPSGQKKRDAAGERSGRRSVSPAGTKMNRSATAATTIDQRRGRINNNNNNNSTLMAPAKEARVMSSPLRVPAERVGEGSRRGQDGHYTNAPVVAATSSGNSNHHHSNSNMMQQQQQGEESESLENPLVSMECFIFL